MVLQKKGVFRIVERKGSSGGERDLFRHLARKIDDVHGVVEYLTVIMAFRDVGPQLERVLPHELECAEEITGRPAEARRIALLPGEVVAGASGWSHQHRVSALSPHTRA